MKEDRNVYKNHLLCECHSPPKHSQFCPKLMTAHAIIRKRRHCLKAMRRIMSSAPHLPVKALNTQREGGRDVMLRNYNIKLHYFNSPLNSYVSINQNKPYIIWSTCTGAVIGLCTYCTSTYNYSTHTTCIPVIILILKSQLLVTSQKLWTVKLSHNHVKIYISCRTGRLIEK